VTEFERHCRTRGITTIKVASTRYAVPFYQAMAYKLSTGVRTTRSFQGSGLAYQPMKKTLA
jgi:ABC-type molybdate transport system substrate-binding protein